MGGIPVCFNANMEAEVHPEAVVSPHGKSIALATEEQGKYRERDGGTLGD